MLYYPCVSIKRVLLLSLLVMDNHIANEGSYVGSSLVPSVNSQNRNDHVANEDNFVDSSLVPVVSSQNGNGHVANGGGFVSQSLVRVANMQDVGNRVANGGSSVNDRVARVAYLEHGGHHVANGGGSISDRLARVANSQDRARQFYLFFEHYRFVLLNAQRDDRRHITRERVLLHQLQAYLAELQGSGDSVLMTRTVALINALIAMVEQRMRAYGRNVADAGRMTGLLMDYFGDVMHL
ncbi:hypothetical protein CTI12_AA556880 [Artemisia annua]|uniref:Uncharacterized protein n=1 Tax=Artemisia annua TaxID=35608 RepID=A0A2U1KVF5_ARTAN|nr:hypothetical protein CTI12_AA556880 [Artemisia annua]